MTTELVLLLALWAFIVLGVFFGEKGPLKVFGRSGPRLGARIEKHVAIGREFKGNGNMNQWNHPSEGDPDGSL